MVSKAESGSEEIVREIRRKPRRKFSSEEKVRIVLEGLKGEESVAAICRREGIFPAMYYKWSKDFLEAGKNGLTRDTQRHANEDEVKLIKQENEYLKYALADSVLEVQRLKKSLGLF